MSRRSSSAPIAARGALERTGVKPGWVDHVVFGNVLQTSVDAHLRRAARRPEGRRARSTCPALTVNRLCGSGIQAAVSGAQMIQLGEAGIVLAGGMENMSQAPHVIRGLRGGLEARAGQARRLALGGLIDPYCGCSMAITAENCAAKYGISRAGAGRVRAAQPAARRRGRGRPARSRRKSFPSRSRRARASPWSTATITCARRRRWRCSGEAAGGVQEGRHRHGRQRERHRRRRRGARPRVGATPSAATG